MVAMGLRWGALKGTRGGEREERDKKDRKPCYTHVRIGARARTSHEREHTHTQERLKIYACIRVLPVRHALTHARITTDHSIETR